MTRHGSLNAEGAEAAEGTQKMTSLSRESDLSRLVIGAAVEVQKHLGRGLLESAYMAAMCIELAERGIDFQSEVPITGHYKGRPLGVAYRADLVVAGQLLVEVKAQEAVTPVHKAQLLSYLRLSGLRLGLLMNFHSFPVARHVHRVANQL